MIAGREQRVARGDDAHRLEQRLGRDILEQEPARTGVEGVVDVLVEVERGEDEDPRTVVAAGGADLARGFDPVQGRHAHVHQDDVGPVLAAEADGLHAVCRSRDDGDVGLRSEQRGESGPYDLVVVGDERADHDASSSSGNVTSTSKPPPSAAPHEKLPPAIVARSRIPTSPWLATNSPSGGPRPWSLTRRSSASAR